ncbi:tetratricopeptide repeat protein [Chryseobacterium vaccae]|uniref:tetratricopeptide repeat protein n=1 Tax=Chryseobacterium vaccae TaxID=2604424 RepID=UPI001297029A|nr:tetratricopeptide repeat protein [Chryseobacterium vaccae]
MKKSALFVFCFIFGFYYAQVDIGFITQIESKIKKAEELAKDKPSQSIELSHEIYTISKKKGYKKGVLESSVMLMARYFDLGNHKKVIDLSGEAEKLALELKDASILANVYRLRASSYTELGFNDECIKELRKALKISEKITSSDKKNYLNALTYIGFASYSAHVNAPLDSVIYYQKKCLESTVKIGNDKDFVSKKYHMLALVNINLGMTSVASGRINDAETYFGKALEICQNKQYNVSKNLEITVLNEYAWLYYDQKEYDKSVYYASRAEQFEKIISMPYIRRDIYEVYFKSYVELGEKTASKKYMNLYTKLNDSLVNAEKKAINIPVKQIMDKQGQAHTGNIRKILLSALALIIFITAAGWVLWRVSRKKLHDKYDLAIKNLENIPATPTDREEAGNSEKSIYITDDTMNMILLKLDKFEKSQKFIKKDLSLTSLANELNTNTRYLSEIIKQHKEKNYNNYINSLRIDYITKKLYENPIYREYKISYLAEACGFSSREVFAVIFKKETGVSPSYFISNLKKDHSESS